MTKLCKDCKWYRKSWFEHFVGMGDGYDRCASPNTTQNLVSGHEKRFCDMLRSKRYEDLEWFCGPEGKYWEAK